MPRRSQPATLRRATIHNSLRWFWWLLEVLPHRVHDPLRNFAVRWIIPLGHRRRVNDGSVIHQSVVDRMKEVPGYRPPNLPATYTVDDGTLQPAPAAADDSAAALLPPERTPPPGTVGLDINDLARRQRKAAPNVLGILAIVVGVVWFLQGSGRLAGSFMTGETVWKDIGGVVAVLGVMLVAWMRVGRYIVNTLAGLAIATGILWVMQGVGWLGGSVMTGELHWIKNGLIAAAGGLLALYLNRERDAGTPGTDQR